MRFSDLARQLQSLDASSLAQQPDLDPEITAIAPIETAPARTLSYIDGGKFAKLVTTTAASALILPKDSALQQAASDRHIAWIATANPRLLFAQAIALFYQPFQPAPGIHPSAVIDSSAKLGNNPSIGAHVVIQADCIVGDDVRIHPNVVLYPGVSVGDRTVLHANCTLHERTQIGADCVIHSGAVIGSEGFGFVPTREGWLKMEQSGRTVLEDGVEIGCNSAVDRPAVGETRIHRNTKLDNLVQIGHGCTIGEACAIAAQTGIAGGSSLGDRVIIGGQVGISNQVHVGDYTQVAGQSMIHSDVPPQSIVMGSPAIPATEFRRIAALWKRLPDMQRTLRQLQKHLGG
ncbi:MAG: UDP-3-O-(3-hydroxymyristoyl)glucosamine N-acyltransferase [Cyanobacteria bacterium J069]|nr:MAG: UDP-3-O-(3-hydroxymyristoyl)glucosamine N-acyltransferase [Cyanobacteria bacterium J069]